MVDSMPADQTATPYADAIARYAAEHPVRWHLPGHGGDTAGETALTRFFGGRAADYDIMPMVEGIDLGPHNPFEQSLALAAEAWGARRTWFLANGASQGNLIAVMATTAFGHDDRTANRGPHPGGGGRADGRRRDSAGAEHGDPGRADHRGDRVVVMQRSVHSSMIDALGMSGGRARFVAPHVDHDHGVAHGVRAADVAAELDACAARGEAVDAVIVVSPSYFGFVADIVAIAGVAHGRCVPLVVDEAWGAHLGFHPRLPARSLSSGADLVVSSTHKLGGSFTQSAMLHLADGPYADVLEARIDRVYRSVQSTSESALLLASLDIARRELATGTERIGRSIDAAEQLAARVRAGGRFGILSDSFPTVPGWAATDPLRVVIDTRVAGLDGRVVRTTLKRDFGLLVELASEGTLVAVVGAGAVPNVEALPAALAALPDHLGVADGAPAARLPEWGPERTSVRAAWLGDTELVHHTEAAGRVSAASLAAYPPGIPNVLPGEEITPAAVDFLRAVAASPAGHVRGAHDPALDHFLVVA